MEEETRLSPANKVDHTQCKEKRPQKTEQWERQLPDACADPSFHLDTPMDILASPHLELPMDSRAENGDWSAGLVECGIRNELVIQGHVGLLERVVVVRLHRVFATIV